jgi:hypothetical protein
VLWFHIVCCFVVISATFLYFVFILVLFSALFLFFDNIIDLVPHIGFEGLSME